MSFLLPPDFSVQLIRLNKKRLRYSLPNANIKAPKPLKAFISACCLGPFDARLSISLVSRSYFLKSNYTREQGKCRGLGDGRTPSDQRGS